MCNHKDQNVNKIYKFKFKVLKFHFGEQKNFVQCFIDAHEGHQLKTEK